MEVSDPSEGVSLLDGAANATLDAVDEPSVQDGSPHIDASLNAQLAAHVGDAAGGLPCGEATPDTAEPPTTPRSLAAAADFADPFVTLLAALERRAAVQPSYPEASADDWARAASQRSLPSQRTLSALLEPKGEREARGSHRPGAARQRLVVEHADELSIGEDESTILAIVRPSDASSAGAEACPRSPSIMAHCQLHNGQFWLIEPAEEDRRPLHVHMHVGGRVQVRAVAAACEASGALQPTDTGEGGGDELADAGAHGGCSDDSGGIGSSGGSGGGSGSGGSSGGRSSWSSGTHIHPRLSRLGALLNGAGRRQGGCGWQMGDGGEISILVAPVPSSTALPLGSRFTLGASTFMLSRPEYKCRRELRWARLAVTLVRDDGHVDDFVVLPPWRWTNQGYIGRKSKKATLPLTDLKARRRHARIVLKVRPAPCTCARAPSLSLSLSLPISHGSLALPISHLRLL